MHLGILTGGGDVPGLNPAIKAVVNEAFARDWRVTGFRRGWAGPVNSDPENLEGTRSARIVLTPDVVRSINRTGGTILHTSRTNPARMRASDLPGFLSHGAASSDEDTVDMTNHVLSVLDALEIDVLIAIGGDDTLSYAARIHAEGVKTMCIPKTMDNDVFGTDYCIGFSTCVTRSVELINRLRTSVGSHERFLVVEMFGRNCGLTALMAGYLADVDRTLIAEVPFDYDKLARQCAAEGVDHVRYLVRLTELELIERERRMVERRIRQARFPAVKSLDSFDFKAIASLNKMLVLELARCEYVERRENIIALGNSGTGKTHIALGLGLAACQKGLSVGFITAAALVHELMEARDEKRLLRLQKQLAKYHLLTIMISARRHRLRPTLDRVSLSGTRRLFLGPDSGEAR